MISTQRTRAEAEMRRAQMKNVVEDSARYRRANGFLTDLRKKWKRRDITSVQYADIRKMATNGDLDGANRALGNALIKNADGRN